MEINIRKVTIDDAVVVMLLSHQLGYPLTIDEIKLNISAILKSKHHTAYVAENNGQVVGWIGAAQAIMIEAISFCEINGLVIDKDHQGKGIGKRLIERVKQWAKEQGNKKVSLRCNVKRTETHEFYKHLGFKDLKQQTNFVLDL